MAQTSTALALQTSGPYLHCCSSASFWLEKQDCKELVRPQGRPHASLQKCLALRRRAAEITAMLCVVAHSQSCPAGFGHVNGEVSELEQPEVPKLQVLLQKPDVHDSCAVLVRSR